MGFLRFLFAIAVVIYHSLGIFGYHIIPGNLAVQSFYMISGFYMALVLNEKYIGKHGSYKLFISNRLIRLYPTYWAVLICSIIFSMIILLIDSNQFSALKMFIDYWNSMDIFTTILLIFSNIFIFFQDAFLFLGLDSNTGSLYLTSNCFATTPLLHNFFFVNQAWTVGLEMMFYLVAPFLLRRKLPFIFTLIILSFALRCILMLNGYSEEPWSYRFFPSELGLFLLGTVAYRIYAKIKNKPQNKMLGISLLAAIIIFTFVYTLVDFRGKYISFQVLLFIALPHIFLLTKRVKYDRWIGELSYPIYISHLLVKAIVITIGIKFNIEFGGSVGLIVCVVSILFSIFLNQVIEIPLDKYRQRRIARSKD